MEFPALSIDPIFAGGALLITRGASLEQNIIPEIVIHKSFFVSLNLKKN